MSSAATVKPGDVLAGKYRVERVLGQGGMGYVVAARHLQLDQLVAMKFLRKSAGENTESGTRFLREAKAVVKLRNEHIAKVFDVGTLENGDPYIVMEHLDGCDLAALAKERHVLPPEEICEYIMQACEALAEAHSLGIVHRDIKLANLFITRGPAGGPLVKVLDFGISKTNPFGESEHDMTRTASMLGSPRFMSPEQMRDPRAVDGRSDLWSLGVVIYRLASGRPPFEADTLGRLLTMVMHEEEAPLASVRKDLPPGFSDVVSRCLEKEPAHRFANVAELAYALVPFSSDPARAHAAAERIAAVLALPHAPNTGDTSAAFPMGGQRPSSSPGAGDPGTAAPWVGTHGGMRLRAPRGATIWLGVALVTMLVGSGLFAMRNRQSSTVGRETDPTTAALVRTDPTASPVQVPTSFVEQLPGPTVIGASQPAAIPPPIATAYVPALESAPTAVRRAPPGAGPRTKPSAPRPPAASKSERSERSGSERVERGESGIPTTRD
jgi:serine/threonine-protein kinase